MKKGYLYILLIICSCVKNTDFDAPKSSCENKLTTNTSFADVKKLYVDEIIQIHEDLILEGYVISSDKAGNFFGKLHIQDSSTNPTGGFQLEIDLRDSHLFYQSGSKVYLKLKGLYLEKSKGVYKIGGVFSAFGNASVGRLPSIVVQQHLFLGCSDTKAIQPTIVGIDALEDAMVNTLVQLEDIEVIEASIGKPFAEAKKETQRILKDCDGDEIALLNSGYSDFQSTILPEGNGTITVVLLKKNDIYQVVIRDVNDIDFSKERCLPDEVTSNQLFISELADPNNNSGARFLELYNASDKDLSLKGWTLRRYTNANTTISATIDLSDFNLAAKSTFVISPNMSEFETVYGFAPHMGVATNSPADSNGDDNLELVDPFGTVIDVFGVVGEDGTKTNHEFEDGRAVRNLNIDKANPTYTFSEWIIFNDTGSKGTTNLPQNAPKDFTPGIRD
ncbi:MAG: nuclease [Flavobacteriaceae bacterium]|nr:MAG: nuclease [Flavobacteriaceae bacterium]